jgi:predicted adenine nucleotide alpha hydrolase (AANH) superfamily ATPase
LKLLLHTCCAPCTIYPLRVLREEEVEVRGYFYRSNIHPFTECLRRQQTLSAYAEQMALPLIIDEAYDLENFLRNIAFREGERCRFCNHDRLRSTAIVASRGKFDAFSTTLLYSKFQKHDTIRAMAEAVASEVGVPFYYRDFRIGWKEGVDRSKELGMYRQQYCGCIYSERERYLEKSKRS